MSDAIVGIREDGIVRAAFAIDCADDERKAGKLAAEWRKAGRTVKRCSWEHAMTVANKPWVDEPNNEAVGRVPAAGTRTHEPLVGRHDEGGRK